MIKGARNKPETLLKDVKGGPYKQNFVTLPNQPPAFGYKCKFSLSALILANRLQTIYNWYFIVITEPSK